MTIHGVYIERRILRGEKVLSADIADHLYTRLYQGKTTIITDRPNELIGVVIKRWRKIERQLLREQSSTLNALRKLTILRELNQVSNQQFSLKPELYSSSEVVSFVPSQRIFELSSTSRTLYITVPISSSALDLAAHWVAEDGLLVLYD